MSQTRPVRQLAFWMSLAVVLLTASLAAQDTPTRTIEVPARVAEMRHHFLDVTNVHEAIIRGDLEATLPPAARLSLLTAPALMPAASAPFVEAIRLAGRRIAQAPTLTTASVEVATMLRQCGGCHQSMSAYPAPATSPTPDLGGIVGHMLEHQRALDDLLLGLVVPSDGRWREGAARLNTAVLARPDWPPARELSAELRRADEAIHELAGHAALATTPAERASIYSRLLLTCASCHSQHARIWGPRSRP